MVEVHVVGSRLPRAARRLRVAGERARRAVAAFVIAAGGLGCEPDGDALPAPGGGTEPPVDGPRRESCEEGATRACTAHHDAGCATGVQTCEAATWSPCRPDYDGTTLTRRDGADGAVQCGSEGTTPNACDAECRSVMPTDPDFGGGGPPVRWETGRLGGLPAGALAAGLPLTCDADADCQFDHYCDEGANGGDGACVAYNPWRGNAACGGDYDITAAVPCGDVVPVCNRGNAVVPAAELSTMRIEWSPAPPWGMDGCALGSPEGSCSIDADADLEVGTCIDVPCAVPADRVVYVDAGSGNASECECANNWTYDAGGACGEPECGVEVSVATMVPLTLFLTLDVSGSMAFHRDCPYPSECSGACDADNCSGACTSETECSSYRGDVDRCCWRASTPETSRWGAIHAALSAFVASEESDELGLVIKTWPEGSCQSYRCNAVDEFIDAGTCAHSPCDPTGTPLGHACAPYVDSVCSTNAREYCCGDLPKGTCAFSPCTASASTLTSGCGGSGTSIRAGTLATCNTRGYEGCCNAAPASGGSWGMNKPPCTATTSMTCRNGSGSSIACDSTTAAGAPHTSLTYSAYLTTTATPSCKASWTASCVDSFRAHFAAQNGGRNPCALAWDAACVAKYESLVGTTAGASCTVSGWDAACVSRFNALGGTCGSTACNHPSIPADCESVVDCPYVLDAAPSDAAELEILAALDEIAPSGGTPSAIAVEGGGDFCRRYEEARPDERCAVVFVSDGQPSQCGSEDDVYTAASDASAGDGKVFAIGISGAGTSFMNELASRGGTDEAVFVSPDTSASEDFLEALERIRNSLACLYRMPEGATRETVGVTWNDGATNPDIADVGSADGCTSSLGYYVDGEEIVICPDTCAAIKAAPGTKVEVANQCGQEATEMVVTDWVTAAEACVGETGARAKWTVLIYEADVPPRSSIAVRVRARADAAAAWSEYVDLVTIVTENEVADLSDPPSIEDALGELAYAQDIEVELSTTVDGGAPTLVGYELQLTCVSSE